MRNRYVSSDLDFSYHLLPEIQTDEMFRVLAGGRDVDDDAKRSLLYRAINELRTAGKAQNCPELSPNIRHLIRLQRMGFSTTENSNNNNNNNAVELRAALEGNLLTGFMPEGARAKFHDALGRAGCGLAAEEDAMHSLNNSQNQKNQGSQNNIPKNPQSAPTTVEKCEEKGLLRIGNVTAPLRTYTDASKIPSPLFYGNEQQNQLLQRLLHAYQADEKAFLLIGNQVSLSLNLSLNLSLSLRLKGPFLVYWWCFVPSGVVH